MNGEARYAEARRLLNENKDLWFLRFYNSYTHYRTLKVLWFTSNDKRARRLRKKLEALADYTRTTVRGDTIYGFEK